jgi:predicted Zn-dependent protease
MAIAGYDPDEAVEVWKRMAQMKEGQTPPKFLSTHPSNETRIRKIKETIPKAKQYL